MEISTTSLYQRHRLSVDDYYRMAEVGILMPDERVELIDGQIIDIGPISPPHAAVLCILSSRLIQAAANRAVVRSRTPVRLDKFNEPEPGVALVRERADCYRQSHPGAEDVLLIVEVAETSQRYDRQIKLPQYAKHGIPEVWLVDVPGKQIVRHANPQGSAYSTVETLDLARPAVVPGLVDVQIPLDELF